MLLGLLFVCLAAIAWGTQGGAFTEFTSTSGAGGVETAFMASAIGAVVMIASAYAARRPWPRLSTAVHVALSIGGFVAAFIGCYFAAISRIGIALAALVAICSAPLFTTLLAVLFLRERLTRATSGALVAGIIGTALVLIGRGEVATTSGARTLVGLTLALAAGLAFAARIVLIRGFVAHVHPVQVAGLAWCGAAGFLGVLVVVGGNGLGSVASGWPWLLYLGLVSMTAGPLLHAAGMSRVPSIPAGIAGLLEPVTATLVALLLFDEHLAPTSWIGAGIVLAALVALAVAAGRRSAGGVTRWPAGRVAGEAESRAGSEAHRRAT